ncbi:MAG: hypothetical protein N3G20_06390, partial [Verrucomicrobiae bacterium]|nr:hypothetical protein [Verrucomicrobiae bacterium]
GLEGIVEVRFWEGSGRGRVLDQMVQRLVGLTLCCGGDLVVWICRWVSMMGKQTLDRDLNLSLLKGFVGRFHCFTCRIAADTKFFLHAFGFSEQGGSSWPRQQSWY